MSLTAAIAIYVVIWWVVLFAVLPFGVRTQEEEDSVVPGSNPSSPVQPFLLCKALATTAISALIFAFLYWLVAIAGVGLDDIRFLPDSALPASSSGQ